MAKDLKYFMRPKEEKVVTIPAPERYKDDEGNVIQMEVRILTQEEIQTINDNYKRHGMATDKKGNPIIYNGEVVWKTERDSAKATRHVIVEALKYPNLKDPELMEYYGCLDLTDMPLKVFSSSDEYQYVVKAVLQALGMMAGMDEEDDLEAAKN